MWIDAEPPARRGFATPEGHTRVGTLPGGAPHNDPHFLLAGCSPTVRQHATLISTASARKSTVTQGASMPSFQ
jgi:hypothetical protein